jgi:hypothetical protein
MRPIAALALLFAPAQELRVAPGAVLGSALAGLARGGTLTLAAGRYPSGQLSLGPSAGGITIRSAPGARAVIDFEGKGGFYLKADGVTLRGLELLNAQNFAVDVDGSDCTIEDCRILGSGGDAVKLSPGNWQQKKYNRGAKILRCEIGMNKGFEGVDGVGHDDVLIQDTYFHDTPGWGVYLKGGATRGVVERCVFRRTGTLANNPAGGVCLGEHTGPDEVMTNKHGQAWESVDCTVRNCLFIDIPSAAMAAWCAKGAKFLNNTAVDVATTDRAAVIVLSNHGLPTTDLTFVNNVVVGSASGGRPLVWIYDKGAAGKLVFDRNCWSGGNGKFWNQAAGSGPAPFEEWRSKHGFDRDGLFADPKLDEALRLKPGSPCVDKGLKLEGFDTDVDGGKRSGAWDIGADESGSGAARPLPGGR